MAKDPKGPCIVCNPSVADQGEYCDTHREELHRLDHRYETMFRLQRISRGRGHEAYELFLQGECDPCGRVVVTETDPENLAITVLLSGDLDLDSRIQEYASLGVDRTNADQIRMKLQQEVVFSWYGNARACVDIFRISRLDSIHWDIDQRTEQGDEENPEFHPPQGSKHSIH